MKFLHLSDLHLGKRLREYDLLEDASFMLQEALSLAKREALDAILVAGDVYDTGAPSGAAQKVLGTFLADCAEARIPVLMIAGNHDSADRLSYLSEFARRGGVHIATEAKDVLSPVSIKGVDFHLLPYQSRASLSLALGEEFSSLGEGISSLFSLKRLFFPFPALFFQAEHRLYLVFSCVPAYVCKYICVGGFS